MFNPIGVNIWILAAAIGGAVSGDFKGFSVGLAIGSFLTLVSSFLPTK